MYKRQLFFLPDWQEEADASDAMAFLRAAWHESEPPTHLSLIHIYKKLLAGAEQLKAAGIPVPMCHISASESSELFPQYALDAVRIGRRQMCIRDRYKRIFMQSQSV